MKILKNGAAFWISIAFYFVIIAFIVLVKAPHLIIDKVLVINRLMFFGLFLLSLFLHDYKELKNALIILIAYALLASLYKETAFLNTLFYPIYDSHLMQWDKLIFGFQPSLEFSKRFDSYIFSELMFFGYFSYYIMPIAVILLVFFHFPDKLNHFGFILITSFLIYYLIFIIFPAWGPQFYLKPPENFVQAKGFFGRIIKIIQENGEAKTAAFPSSHVGVSVIILIWLKIYYKKIVLYFIPSVLLLILATIYIKAHYAVDVLVGIPSAFVVYYISNQLYKLTQYGRNATH